MLKIKTTYLIKLSLALLLVISTNTQASLYDSRVEKWEFFLAPQFTNSKTLEFGNGSSAEINDRSGLGFGFGYNMNAHLEFSGLFSSSNANYTGTRIIDNGSNTPEKFTANMYTSSINFDVTYNLLKGPFTPYISANFGTTYIDSGVPTGNIESGFCWDPWYGYYRCASAQTFTSTEFTYGAGIGLRYDFNRKLYIKGGVATNIIDTSSINTADFTTYRFIIGFMF